MDDIRKQAIEAARDHAHSVDDLITQALKIEHYLNGGAYTSREWENTPKPEVIETALNQPSEDQSVDNLAEELRVLAGVVPCPKTKEELAYERNSRLDEVAMNVNLFSEPLLPVLDFKRPIAEFTCMNVNNQPVNLKPILLQIATYFETENVVLNVGRQQGTTTLLAAFARDQCTKGQKVLVITSSHTLALHMEKLIDDASVNVATFSHIAKLAHSGEFYDFILIDNAAYIPYSLEDAISEYLMKCHIPAVVELRDLATGPAMISPTRLIMASAPGQARGWFYEAFLADDDARKLSIDWKLSDMSAAWAKKLKKEIGETAFTNQYENQFRLVDNHDDGYPLTV